MISLLSKYVNELTYNETGEQRGDVVNEAYHTFWNALSCSTNFPSPVPQ